MKAKEECPCLQPSSIKAPHNGFLPYNAFWTHLLTGWLSLLEADAEYGRF